MLGGPVIETGNSDDDSSFVDSERSPTSKGTGSVRTSIKWGASQKGGHHKSPNRK